MSNPHRDRAVEAWGDPLPDWLQVLTEECGKASQNAVAKRLGVSSTLISRVLSKTYQGDTEGFAERVRGALLSRTVECPVLGEVRRDRCLTEQGKKLTFENPLRPTLYEACRSGCPHSRIGETK